MVKLTLKEIKNADCDSLNNLTFEKAKEFKEHLGNYVVLGVSVGKYGINGKFIYSRTLEKFYKITDRCVALLIIE